MGMSPRIFTMPFSDFAASTNGIANLTVLGITVDTGSPGRL